MAEIIFYIAAICFGAAAGNSAATRAPAMAGAYAVAALYCLGKALQHG